MKKLCITCELIKTGGIFTGGECKEHPKKKPFFKGYIPTMFFRIK